MENGFYNILYKLNNNFFRRNRVLRQIDQVKNYCNLISDCSILVSLSPIGGNLAYNLPHEDIAKFCQNLQLKKYSWPKVSYFLRKVFINYFFIFSNFQLLV